MTKIKWVCLPENEKEKLPADDRMMIIDCGRARELTKGPGGNTLEHGFPPFNHSFP